MESSRQGKMLSSKSVATAVPKRQMGTYFNCLRASSHQRQEPFLVAHKTYTKPSTFVKYVIKLVGAANPIADSKFVEEYVMNNKANQIF